MTRELDIQYPMLCGKCKKKLIETNKHLILRLLHRDSYETVKKLTGIPKETLRTLRHPEYQARKSGSNYFRTSGLSPDDVGNIEKKHKEIMETTESAKKSGQKPEVKNGGPE